MSAKVPTTIVTGFLGSGKTTIISHLIDDLVSQKMRVAYIKNEIGSENIDGQLFKGKNIETQDLLNGCICCTLVGPFIQSVDELIDKVKPDRIIIEASGAADPSAIALMVSSHPSLLRDGVLSVIDVVNFEGYKDLSETAKNQAKFTDLVIFNKVELVDIDRKRAVVGYIRELNTSSPIVEAPQGKILPTVAFGLDSQHLTQLLSHHPDHHDHLSQDGLETFSLSLDHRYSKAELLKILQQLPANIIRVKGIIHSTQELLLVNGVGKRFDLSKLEQEKVTSKLVFIGFRIAQHQSTVAQLFQSTTR